MSKPKLGKTIRSMANPETVCKTGAMKVYKAMGSNPTNNLVKSLARNRGRGRAILISSSLFDKSLRMKRMTLWVNLRFSSYGRGPIEALFPLGASDGFRGV